jgi:hypothetical protein
VELQITAEFALGVMEPSEAAGPAAAVASIEAALRHPDYVDGMSAVLDMRKVSLATWSADDLRLIGSLLEPLRPRLPRRIAIVAPRDVDYGVLRMWQVYSERHVPHERQVFRDIDSAREWLLSASRV